MRLHVFSDLHEESRAPRLGVKGTMMKKDRSLHEEVERHIEKHGDHGVCILAGDIIPLSPLYLRDAKRLHQQFARWFKHVIFVPGNHEFYGTSIREGLGELRSWSIKGWHLLEPERPLVIDGQRFSGGTLWHDGHHEHWRERGINDYNWILGMGMAYDHNIDFVEHVCGKMTSDDIVVSHHLPSPRSTPPEYADSSINCFFVSDQEKHILERKPKAWIHGHTHDPADYILDSTHVYANPRGYRGEYANPKFWERIVIDV